MLTRSPRETEAETYAPDLSTAARERIKALDVEFTIRCNNREPRDRVVCETIQKCFDILVEAYRENHESVADWILRIAIPDQLLEVAVAREWLPEAMAPARLPHGHREWFLKILEGRMRYSAAREPGLRSDYTPVLPGFVVIPVPETDALMQEIACVESIKELHARPLRRVDEELIRRHVQARGIPPESNVSREFLVVQAGIAAKSGKGVKAIRSNTRKKEIATSVHLENWSGLEITFLSDERVQIQNGFETETRNYEELGFVDRRNGKPNRAWEILRLLAESLGLLDAASAEGWHWSKIEKGMQEVRKALRLHFKLSTDPAPFVKGIGYRTKFRVNRSRASRT